MKRITDRLFIGDLGDCKEMRPEDLVVVHACKYPCFAAHCADRYGSASVKSSDAHYLASKSADGRELFLNIVDPPTPLFKAESFQIFLEFCAEHWKAGREILIHCNQGKSRAPSLALVFLAKCLGAVSDETFDLAWDQFEPMAGSYAPGAGIETWLRANWRKVRGERLAWITGAAAKHVPQVDQVRPIVEPTLEFDIKLTPAEAIAALKTSPYVHFYTAARITDKEGILTPANQHIVPNVFQMRACEAYEWCVANGVPIRLVLGPKPRQSGGSTISAELCYHHTVRFKCSGMVLADENSRTDLVWNMFNRIAENDRFRSIWGVRHDWHSERATFNYKNEDGQDIELEWLRDTASDPKAGASGTRQILWFSEAGRYSKEGKVTDTQVISNASSSVPEKAGTMIILESTAEGASGYFYNIVKGAVTLEERMQGRVGNGWIKVSCWWHECPDYLLKRTPLDEEWFQGTLTEREKRGVQLYDWTAEQVAWRRKKIKGSFDGNEKLFDQEFPESEDVAFQASGDPRFDIDGLARLEHLAKLGHDLGELGSLDENAGLITFTAPHEQPWLWVKERPMYGARYILSMDCMTGEQSKGSRERDTHAAGVWRAPYKDKNGVFHGAKLVAAIHVPGGCRWDEDVIAKRSHLLSKFYGNCIMAVEVNEAMGILRELIHLQANLWHRTKADEAAGVVGATLKIPGWKTTSGAQGTRSILVAAVATFVREKSGEVQYKPWIQQAKVFVTYPDGSCAAKPGEHDDWILSSGIALALMDAATELTPPAARTLTVHGPDTSGFRGKGSGAVG